MSWYLYRRNRSEGPYSVSDLWPQLCLNTAPTAHAPALFRWAPQSRSIIQAVAIGIFATGMAWLIVDQGVNALLTSGGARQGLTLLTLTWIIALLVVLWSWSGLWRLSYSKRHTAPCRFGAVFGVLLSLCTLVLLSGLSVSQAMLWFSTANRQSHFQVVHVGQEIEMRGDIGKTSAEELDHMLKAHPKISVLRLNLSGGLVEEAKKIRRLIRRHRLNTYVSDHCSSACTIAFMGGVKRLLRRDAQLGFHRYLYIGLSPESVAAQDDIERAYLVSLGLPPWFAQKIFSTETPWYPTVQELLEAHIVTDIVEQDASLPYA